MQALSSKSRNGAFNARVSGRRVAMPSKPVRSRMAANAALKVMISGAPAAGKGTQCAKIIEKYNLVHISVGDILRWEVQNQTPVGNKAKGYMDQGILVPDEVVVEMVKSRLGMKDCEQRGWLLDGYPRSGAQAEAIEKEGIRPDVFLLMEVPEALLVERVVGRRSDPVSGEIFHMKYKPPPKEIIDRLEQRSDDTEEKVRTRIDTYNSNVNAVMGYYQDMLVKIKGDKAMEEVFWDVCKVLDAKLASQDPMEEFCQGQPEADECRVY